MKRFDPAKSARLDDPARFAYLSLESVFELLDAPAGAIVVDYGSGTGAFAIPLARARGDLRVIAYDVEPHMLALARAKPGLETLPNIDFAGAIADALHGCVQRVLGVNVLHELEDSDLATIRKLLAPGGRFVSVDWNAAPDRPVGPPAERVYDEPAARALLERAGFEVRAGRAFPFHHALIAEPRGG